MLREPNTACETRESGGIGRRARLRGVWSDSYGFKSRLSHHERTGSYEPVFSCPKTGLEPLGCTVKQTVRWTVCRCRRCGSTSVRFREAKTHQVPSLAPKNSRPVWVGCFFVLTGLEPKAGALRKQPGGLFLATGAAAAARCGLRSKTHQVPSLR